MSLNKILRTLKLSHIFEELARIVFRVYHNTGQYTAFARRINLAPSKSRAVPDIHLHETSTRVFSSRAIQAINDCLTPIDNRGCLIRFCSSSDSMKLLQRCSHKKLFSRIQLSGLRYEVMLRLIVTLNCCSIAEINSQRRKSFRFIYGKMHYLVCCMFEHVQQILMCFRRGDFLSQL